MTRNEWIAETMSRTIKNYAMPVCGHVGAAIAMADALEAANVAPWTAPAPALTDTAAKVVEAAVAWSQKPRTFTDIDHLEYAVRAHLAAKQGGAK